MKVLISEKLSTHKYKTPEGYLICTDAILARTGKQQYTKDEVFRDGDTTIIDIDRPYEQVMSEKTISSFENKPVTFDHPNEDVNVGNYKEYAVGYVRDVHQGKVDGQDVILGNLIITDQNAIDAIESGEHTDLSCGYDCDIKDNGSGQYFQSNIRGNHVALCKEGRAGNARIVDSKGEKRMKIRDEDRQIEVYKLCKENNWYTLGDIDDYDYMLNHADIWPVEKIAMNIANHSHEGYTSILNKLKTKLKDSRTNDAWSGTRNGIIYSYHDGYYYITHKNGKVERLPESEFNTIEELYTYVDKIDDSKSEDMAQRVFKFSTNIPALKRAISNGDKEEVKSMLATLQKDKTDFEKWDEQGQMSNFDKKIFEKTMSEVMPGIKKMGLTLDSKKMTLKNAMKMLRIIKEVSK